MMKMMINLLLGVMMSGLSEALMFGRKGGLEMEDMLEVVLNGPLANLLFETKSAMIRQEEYPVNFPLKHMAKDMKYIIDTAHENMAHVPGAHSALTLYDLARGLGMGDEDFAAVARMFPR
jgi:3-hydroxyisobutyrate dehydrogenase-like beta-hydroxyacid dehydrogenase